MAITGVLKADFSEFYTAVQKAEGSLKGLEGGAGKTETALTEMTAAPVAPLNTLKESFGQVDQALSASGINVGKYARGLTEIADMAGKTVSEVGLLGTGLAVASAAMAGWNFGRWIADITGADQAIANLTARVMGYGDVVAQTAGAQQDTINRAITQGAKETISYSEAIQFNLRVVQDQSDAYAVSSERLADAQKEVRGLSKETIDAIEIAKRNHATTEQITKAYGISADGLRALADRQKLAGQAADEHTKAMEKQRSEAAALDKAYDKLMSDVSNANQLAIMEADHARMVADEMKKKNAAAANWIAANVKATAAVKETAAAEAAYLTEQTALTAATDALSQAHAEGGEAAKQATAVAVQGYQGVAQQVQITGDAIKEWIKLMQYSAQVNAILNQNSLFTTQSQLDQIANLGKSGGGATVSNVFNIVDTEANIAKRVSDHITRSLMQSAPMGAT